MAQAKQGDTVKVHYTGKLEDGSTFDTSVGGEPLEFTMGDGELLPAFEKAVMGMKAGDSKTVTLTAEEGYGPYREEMVLEVDRGQIPPDINPEIGQQLELKQADGDQEIAVVVTASTDKSITLDANHPLAGKPLVFDIELVEITTTA